jgi:catalase-peroxidase
VWDNAYFRNLVDYEWEVHQGPGGHHQWRVAGGKGPQAPVADLSAHYTQDIMMLTTDIALKVDPEYQQYVHEFAANETAFAEYFAKAWYKLITRDMGPIDRCVGPNVAPPQHFQLPLPDPPKKMADTTAVARHLHKLMERDGNDDEFLRLAFLCASSFRATDFRGGCNGARIRFHLDWPINAGLGAVLEKLEPIKTTYDKHLTWADLIVLAGNVAAERSGSPKLTFCPGRSDASSGWTDLSYKIDRVPETVDDMIELYQRRGQTSQEFVALTFVQFRSSHALRHELSSHSAVSNDILIQALTYTPELRYWADHYAAAGDLEYANDFRTAWTRLMNADRFDGPVHRVC